MNHPRGKGKTDSELRKFGLLGFEIGGWGALSALVVSVGTLCWTVTDKLLLKPRPELVPPQTIEFWCKDWISDATTDRQTCKPDNFLLIRANPLTFLNRAIPPHSYVLRSISANIGFRDKAGTTIKKVALQWQYFTEISLTSDKRTPVSPFTVEGGAAIAREIEFYPRLSIARDQTSRSSTASRVNFFDFSEFLSLVSSGRVADILVRFEAETFDSRANFHADCEVPVDDLFVSNASRRALFVRECFVGMNASK